MRLAKSCVVCGDVVEFIIPNSPQWISVEDRLPSVGKGVLACQDKKVYYAELKVGMLTRRDCWYSITYGILLHVTHWMPLPEPPTDE